MAFKLNGVDISVDDFNQIYQDALEERTKQEYTRTRGVNAGRIIKGLIGDGITIESGRAIDEFSKYFDYVGYSAGNEDQIVPPGANIYGVTGLPHPSELGVVLDWLAENDGWYCDLEVFYVA